MEKIDRFNIRIYALIVNKEHILTLNEPFWGKMINKFPGGGLEYGESTAQCLTRELKEELDLDLESIEHFYTQEDFIRSGFKANEQLFTVYYKVSCKNLKALKILEPKIESVKWVEIKAENLNYFDLPVDKIVFQKLCEDYSSSNKD